MSGSILLTVPTLTTPGPAYATQISNDLTKIAGHNHDGVNNGATIDIAAQTVGEDLSLQHHNLSNVRSIEFDSQPSVLTGSQDVLALYVNQGNLGFNSSDGTFIPLTQGDSPAPSPLNAFLNWTIRGGGAPVTANASILLGDTYNFIALNSAGGAFTVTLPIAATITPTSQKIGRLYVFRDVNNACGSNPVTIQVSPGSGNTFGDDGNTSFTLHNNGAYLAIYTDGVSTWFPWGQNAYQGESIRLNSSTQSMNSSALNFVGGTLALDSGSSETITGGTLNLVGATATVNGGLVAHSNSAAVTYASSSTSSFATGTTETFAAGSNLVVNGTETINGVLAMLGAETVQGTVTYGAGNVVNGTENLIGGNITATSSSVLSLDKTCTYTNDGLTKVSGLAVQVHQMAAGSYTVDSGTSEDYYIGLQLTLTGVWNITLPASPAVGRVIVIGDAVGLDAFTTPPSYTLNIIGNGNVIGNISKTGGTSATLSLNGGSTTYFRVSWWSLQLTWIGTVWTPNISVNGAQAP